MCATIDGCRPTTIPEIFADRVKKSGNDVALHIKRAEVQTWTFAQYYRDCLHFACGLIELGVPERSCVNIIGYNCPEWLISYVGILRV